MIGKILNRSTRLALLAIYIAIVVFCMMTFGFLVETEANKIEIPQ